MKNYQQELQSFKQQWPDIRFLDLIYTDINATPGENESPLNQQENWQRVYTFLFLLSH